MQYLKFVTFSLLLLVSAPFAQALEIVVQSEADSGDLTFRTAIQKAFDATEDVSITFDSGVDLIRPSAPLPPVQNIAHAITIDGGGGVLLDGSLLQGFVSGLQLNSPDITVRGLKIINFGGAGIQISGDSNVVVQGCLIGTDGAAAAGNVDGINITGGSGHLIGGSLPGERNVISGQLSAGIRLVTGAGNVTIKGNYIGTTPDGLLPLGNAFGIYLNAGAGHQIGGTAPGEGNVISGNTSMMGGGVYLLNAGDGSVIEGNIIGMDATGLAPLPNMAAGVAVENADNVQLGGDGTGAKNTISGNQGLGVGVFQSLNATIQGNHIGVNLQGNGAYGNAVGIYLDGASTALIGGTQQGMGNVIADAATVGIQVRGNSEATIQGNIIGTNAAGTTALGCGTDGIAVTDSLATIGGFSNDAGNTIAYNVGAGVFYGVSRPVTIRRNSIFNNGFGAIAIGGDPGPSLAAPVLTSSFPIAGTATPLSTVEFFVDDATQCRTYVGSAAVAGDGSFTSPLFLSAYRGLNLTATLTISTGYTSQVSAPLEIQRNGGAHTVDLDADFQFSLSEILRVIQFFNAGQISCATPIGSTEDGYAPEAGDQTCAVHPSDYAPQDWSIGLTELLRAIQIFNVGAYLPCDPNESSEDGYCTVIALP
jgi:hypothetical protein